MLKHRKSTLGSTGKYKSDEALELDDFLEFYDDLSIFFFFLLAVQKSDARFEGGGDA
jgi:hypothetical protein